MENSGESADKNIPRTVNEENNPKKDDTPTEIVQEIVNKIIEADVTESTGGIAVKEGLNANVSPLSPRNMDDYDDNPLASIYLGEQEELRKYSFRFKKSDKG